MRRQTLNLTDAAAQRVIERGSPTLRDKLVALQEQNDRIGAGIFCEPIESFDLTMLEGREIMAEIREMASCGQ